jgi:pyridoxal phosphate enzyme (YggS family)
MSAVSPESTGEMAARFAAVRERMAAACARAHRPADSVTLVAVSKTHPPQVILQAIACGQTHFGENRIEEAAEKIAAVRTESPIPVTWHMIGHVQSRKAREVVAAVDYIHSLDSLKLAERYARFAQELKRTARVLLEINVSGEASKSGFQASSWRQNAALRESLWSDIRRIIELPGLRVEGLMTMAPIVERAEQARPVFTALRALRDALAADFPGAHWQTLSMGMTDDYEVAIEEGATMIRVGRALFGPREQGV